MQCAESGHILDALYQMRRCARIRRQVCPVGTATPLLASCTAFGRRAITAVSPSGCDTCDATNVYSAGMAAALIVVERRQQRNGAAGAAPILAYSLDGATLASTQLAYPSSFWASFHACSPPASCQFSSRALAAAFVASCPSTAYVRSLVALYRAVYTVPFNKRQQ